MFGLGSKKSVMPAASDALPDRASAILPSHPHFVLNTPLVGPFPDGLETAMIGMGCFWGAERLFWKQDGIYTTAVGYSAGFTANPSYEDVCTGGTGHNEVVLIVFDPKVISYSELLALFWENHDPTQGMRQGNDIGTQYRSGVYYYSEDQMSAAKAVRGDFDKALQAAGHGSITTEIKPASDFYYAEDYHQQYLAKNPDGYCGIGGTGVSCPIGLGTKAAALASKAE